MVNRNLGAGIPMDPLKIKYKKHKGYVKIQEMKIGITFGSGNILLELIRST